MTANPIELVGGLASTGNVSKADLVAWAKGRVEQVLADATELRNTTLAGQLVVQLKANGFRYVQDTADTTTADDGNLCIVSADGKRFKRVSLAAPTATTLGGLFSNAGVSHKFVTGLDTSGNFLLLQPSAADLSNGVIGTGAVVLQSYVDSAVQGLDPKASVFCASTANLTLSGEQTIDGQLTSTSRVLVKDQTTASQNGIYVTAAGAWTRATDFDAWTEIPGAYVFVEKGTLFADCGFVCTSDAGGTLGTTAVTFVQFAGAGTYTASYGLTLTGTQFSVGLTGLTASLGGNVGLSNTANYFDGPSVAQGTTGTFVAFGSVVVNDTAGTAHYLAKLWDGTTVIASADVVQNGANNPMTIALSGKITNPAGNLRISVRDASSTSGAIYANSSGNGKDSTLTVLRIA